MKRILAALIATTALAGAAQAADLATKYPVKAPVVVPVFSWTGFYIGGNVGYGWGDASQNNVTVNGFASPYYGSGFSPDGFFAGGQIGYNYQFANNVVVGVETDLQWADLSDSNNLNDQAKLEYFGTIRARLGYAFDRFLPYITGGAAYGQGQGDLRYGAYTFGDSQTQWGWTIGGGVEYAITNNWTAKIEYLYVDLGSKTYNWAVGNNLVAADVDLTASTLKLGVNYKF